ncbi:MAG TPA: hypothetical protein VHA75_00265, partial [Rugosimonospora sp.]|nr:hypothetical protein [Rugosimonospora sp.]
MDQAAVRRRLRGVLRVSAGYAAGTVLALGLFAVAVVGRDRLAAALFAAGAVQALCWDALIVNLLLGVRRLSRPPLPRQLTIGEAGVDDGTGLLPWDRVRQVRVYRDSAPRVLLRGPVRFTGRSYQPLVYATTLDDLASACAPYRVPYDPGAPRPPRHDSGGGADEFYFRLWPMRARRRAYLRRCLLIGAMVVPTAAGLAVLGQPRAAAVLAALWLGAAVAWGRQAARAHRVLRRLGGADRGRLRLTREHLVWPGTHVPIAWSHVHDVTVDRSGALA